MNSELDWGTWNWDPGAPAHDEAHDDALPTALGTEVPGEQIWNESGSVYVHAHAYPLSSDLKRLSFARHGETYLDDLNFLMDTRHGPGCRSLHDCVFVDCETTGLGRTSVPFMVGVAAYAHVDNLTVHQPLPQPDGSLVLRAGTLDMPQGTAAGTPTHFVVRQLFALHPGEEGAVLEALQALVAPYAICVTFNGRAFDIPLLRHRYAYYQIRFPELPLMDPFARDDLVSLDLLPIARKLWRRRIGSCALTHCEWHILKLQRSHTDVPGTQIPGIYRHFLATGATQALGRVFYHNRQDIVSMAFLLEEMVKTVAQAAPASASPLRGEDALALARIHMQRRDFRRGTDLLRHAIKFLTGHALQAEAFYELAQWHKRQQDWDAAVRLWEAWISTAVKDSPLPYLELAKFYEWQRKDLEQAEVYTRWALHVGAATGYKGPAQARAAALQHRLRRLQRKIAARDQHPPKRA